MIMETTAGADLLMGTAGGGEGQMGLDELIHQFTGGNKMKPSFLKKLYQNTMNVDVQKTGHLDYEMFCRVFEAEASDLMWAMFQAFDADSGGTVDLKELVVALGRFTSASKTDKLKFAFMMFDEDGNGTIDPDELRKIIAANFVQEKLTKEDIEARCVQLYDRMGQPYGTAISFEMFMQMSKVDPASMFPQQQNYVGVDGDRQSPALGKKLERIKSKALSDVE